MKEVYGFNVDPEDMDGDFLAYTVDHLFGDVWARAGLGVDERDFALPLDALMSIAYNTVR